MNRVIVGIFSVFIIIAIVLLVARVFQIASAGRSQINVPTSGKLVLPSSPSVGFTSPPIFSSPTLVSTGSTVARFMTPSPIPSPSSMVAHATPSAVRLPATGF